MPRAPGLRAVADNVAGRDHSRLLRRKIGSRNSSRCNISHNSMLWILQERGYRVFLLHHPPDVLEMGRAKSGSTLEHGEHMEVGNPHARQPSNSGPKCVSGSGMHGSIGMAKMTKIPPLHDTAPLDDRPWKGSDGMGQPINWQCLRPARESIVGTGASASLACWGSRNQVASQTGVASLDDVECFWPRSAAF